MKRIPSRIVFGQLDGPDNRNSSPNKLINKDENIIRSPIVVNPINLNCPKTMLAVKNISKEEIDNLLKSQSTLLSEEVHLLRN